MSITTLTRADAPELADYTRMTDVALRRSLEVERGLFMAESSTVIRRAVAAGHRPRSFLMAPKYLADLDPLLREVGAGEHGPVPVYLAEEDLLKQITGFHLHRGALAAMHRPELPAVTDVVAGARRVAVLEDVVDHTNVGAAFRSAAALGMDAVLVTPRCADPLYRRSVRVSMGTVFQVPWTRIHDWPHAAQGQGRTGGVDLLRQLGFTTAALALDATAISLDELAESTPDKLALVLGTEGDGLGHRTVADVDMAVQIPMAGGVDSLNVAAAAAVAFWAIRID